MHIHCNGKNLRNIFKGYKVNAYSTGCFLLVDLDFIGKIEKIQSYHSCEEIKIIYDEFHPLLLDKTTIEVGVNPDCLATIFFNCEETALYFKLKYCS